MKSAEKRDECLVVSQHSSKKIQIIVWDFFHQAEHSSLSIFN